MLVLASFLKVEKRVSLVQGVPNTILAECSSILAPAPGMLSRMCQGHTHIARGKSLRERECRGREIHASEREGGREAEGRSDRELGWPHLGVSPLQRIEEPSGPHLDDDNPLM